MEAIKVGLAISHILKNSIELSAIIEGKVFPNIVPDEDSDSEDRLPFPLITYHRAVEGADTKDQCTLDESIVTIDCWSEDYPEVVNIASLVVDELRGAKGVFAGIKIRDIKFQGCTESYVNPFLQTITFKIV